MKITLTLEDGTVKNFVEEVVAPAVEVAPEAPAVETVSEAPAAIPAQD